MYKVKDHSNLVRDPTSKAIINLDTAGLESYKLKREERRKQNEQISNNTQAIDELKKDMGEIKDMLRLLLNNNKGK